MNTESIAARLKETLGDRAEFSPAGTRRAFCGIACEDLTKTVSILRGLGFTYLATITALDCGDRFELLYHFADTDICLTVKTTIPRDNPVIPTITPVIPGAILYERELQDMFGIKVMDIPDPRPLLLPDDWKDGEYPLRKDWTFQMPLEKLPGGDQ